MYYEEFRNHGRSGNGCYGNENGGISIIKITGLLDGVKGNTKVYLFGKLVNWFLDNKI